MIIAERNMYFSDSSLFQFKSNSKMGDLMSESNSKNLEVPSCTRSIPGACCNHPISSEEPRKVFTGRDLILRMPILTNCHFIAVFSTTVTKKLSVKLLFWLNDSNHKEQNKRNKEILEKKQSIISSKIYHSNQFASIKAKTLYL